jgi:hypothetical protein
MCDIFGVKMKNENSESDPPEGQNLGGFNWNWSKGNRSLKFKESGLQDI